MWVIFPIFAQIFYCVNGYIQNLMDDQTNISDQTDLYKLHRSYAYNDSTLELAVKQIIRGL